MSDKPYIQRDYDIFGEDESRPRTQAERVLAKFGGARRLSALLDHLGRSKDPASIYKWTYPKERGGTGGVIPTSAWKDLILAARMEGILLTSDDMDCREK